HPDPPPFRGRECTEIVARLLNHLAAVKRIICAGGVALAAAFGAFAGPAPAQAPYPTRAVKLIVPFPGGGINDILARIVGEKLQANSLHELIDYVKANAGKVTFGSQGNGATPHLTGMMFQTMTGTRMVHVPYRGETLVLQDMLGGHVDVFFGNVAAARP